MSLRRFPVNKNGDAKMNRYDRELLDKQISEAEYKMVTIEACDQQRGKTSCLRCGFPFPASEGYVSLKYLLVRRPSGRKRKWDTRSVGNCAAR